jgi:hypothetical protein
MTNLISSFTCWDLQSPSGIWGPLSSSSWGFSTNASHQGFAGSLSDLESGFSPLARVLGQMLNELQSDSQQWAHHDQAAHPDWQEVVGRWQGLFDSFNQHLPQHWQQQLQQQLEEQLGDLAPPEVITWLQGLQQQQQQQSDDGDGWQQQQQQQLRHPAHSPPSKGSSSSSSSSNCLSDQPSEQQKPLLPWQKPQARAAVQQLQQLGAQVHLPTAAALAEQQQQQQGWGSLAGYEQQKQTLEDCLLLPLKHPEVIV